MRNKANVCDLGRKLDSLSAADSLLEDMCVCFLNILNFTCFSPNIILLFSRVSITFYKKN